jgi:hypothetical protein
MVSHPRKSFSQEIIESGLTDLWLNFVHLRLENLKIIILRAEELLENALIA